MGRRAGVTSDETRRELLAATTKVLLNRGYEGTRVSEIAREAGVTPGAIYNHFSSKAELLTEAIRSQGPDAIDDLLHSGGGGEVLDAFRAIGAALPERAHGLGALLLELVVTSTRDDDVAAVVRGGLADKEVALTEVVRLAQGAGQVDPDLDPAALARFTTMVVLGSLVAQALRLAPVDREAWAQIIDRTLASVGPREVPG